MQEPGLRALVRSDLERYWETLRLRAGSKANEEAGRDAPTTRRKRIWIESFLFKAGFQAALLYRISHWLYRRGWIHAAWATGRLNQFLTGAEIEFNAEIGPGLFIAHPSGIVVGRYTRLGARTTLFQNVTFGARSWRPDEIGRMPTAEDDCVFFANAVIVGGIRIGSECVIAAGAVVERDAPAGALARGVPAEIVPGRGAEMLREWRTAASNGPQRSFSGFQPSDCELAPLATSRKP